MRVFFFHPTTMNPVDDPEFLRERIASKKRHVKQSKAMCMLTESDNKKMAAEIKRLRTENAELRQRLVTAGTPKETTSPITPKQALVRAGMFNVHHNDVLRFAPLLLAAYASATGRAAIEKKGLKSCFPKEDLDLVVRLVEELAPIHLEQAWIKRCKIMAQQQPPPPPS